MTNQMSLFMLFVLSVGIIATIFFTIVSFKSYGISDKKIFWIWLDRYCIFIFMFTALLTFFFFFYDAPNSHEGFTVAIFRIFGILLLLLSIFAFITYRVLKEMSQNGIIVFILLCSVFIPGILFFWYLFLVNV